MTGPCSGIKVVDLSTGPVGGIATMILADFGAEVVKVEPPGGDPFASLAAAPMWLRGKRRQTLDLKTPAGIVALDALVADADVVVTSWRPGVAERLSAGAERLRALNPRLVYCSITGFGPRGPLAHVKGYEGVVAARSGRMMVFAGQLDRPGPIYQAVQLGTHAASQAAVQGILAALLVREQTGRGELVETSLLQGMIPYDMAGIFTVQLMRLFPEQFPVDPNTVFGRQPTLQYQPVMAKDGRWIQLGNLMEHLFHAFLGAADLGWIYGDPRFQDAPQLDEKSREALRDVILEQMQSRTADEWMEIFVADGNIVAETVVSTQEGLGHPQMIHNRDVVAVEHSELGPMRQVGLVAKLTATPGAIPGEIGAPPGPVPAGSNGSAPAPTRAVPEVRDGEPPLAGVTVLEFATIIAAPLACAYLADLGARVIKVETLEGDGLRNLGPGTSAIKTTANKESICLDLKQEEGRAIARELIAHADVIVHNYRLGVPERLGIGYEQARAINPGIIYVNAMGYGTSGPHAHRPSTHPVAGAATGGARWQAGGGWPPAAKKLDDVREAARQIMRANETNPDPSTSMAIVTGALLALYARRTQGIGQQVDMNMFIANAYANADDFISYEGKPPRRPVDPDLHGLHARYRLYEAADGWVFLACLTDGEWDALLQTIDLAHLRDDPRFATRSAREENDAALAEVLAEAFKGRSAEEWETLLTAADVACVQASRAAPGGFWSGDPQVLANGFALEAEHPVWGPLLRHGPVVSIAGRPDDYRTGTVAGEHTVALLHELGYDDATIERLREARTIGVAEVVPAQRAAASAP